MFILRGEGYEGFVGVSTDRVMKREETLDNRVSNSSLEGTNVRDGKAATEVGVRWRSLKRAIVPGLKTILYCEYISSMQPHQFYDLFRQGRIHLE